MKKLHCLALLFWIFLCDHAMAAENLRPSMVVTASRMEDGGKLSVRGEARNFYAAYYDYTQLGGPVLWGCAL